MNTKQEIFGQVEAQDIAIFTLQNDRGMELKAMTYGATITSLKMPDGPDGSVNVVAGFDRLDGYFDKTYLDNSPYFGGTIGRYCSMIKDAKFELDGQTYTLFPNGGEHNLHGGQRGFDKQIWTGQLISSDELDANTVGVRFTRTSPDGEEGFPGEILAQVDMCINNDNQLVITYNATTTKPTPLAMTNHSYFNLSGFKEDVLDYDITIPSTKVLPLVCEGNYEEQVRHVAGTIEDIRGSRLVRKVHDALGTGFEHFYMFDEYTESPRELAYLHDAHTGRALRIASTEHGMLFYTGKYTSDELKRETGEQYGKHRACCFEAHRCPCGPKLTGVDGIITTPEKPFYSQMTYTFEGF